MKVLVNKNNRYKNTYESKEIRFAISEKEQRHIMTMLRDQIYSDKILAPIREYICNAFDANIEVGKNQTPINIQIPNSIEPIWSVRDFGPGLTQDEIRNIFTKYGESTKRNSNDVTGCLGIGSKSAFAYTDQFTVESYKDGTKTTYVAAINEYGDAIIHIASVEQTSEPNGVRISIPVKADDINIFTKRTLGYLRSIFLAGTPYTIINEEHEEHGKGITKHYEATDKSWYIAASDDYFSEFDSGNAKIIMGHVCYELDTHQLYKMSDEITAIGECSALFIRMPLGSLSIAASRESLEYNEQTLAYLNSTLPGIRDNVQKTVCDNIIHADNLYEATKFFNTANEDLPYKLKHVLKNIVHASTGETVKQNLNFHYKQADGTNHAMDCDEYEVRTLRTGKTQIKKAQRQYLRPEQKTVLFYNDLFEPKTTRGRRIKAYLTNNPTAQVIIVNETMETILKSTMASYSQDLLKISDISPLPINYNKSKMGLGVNGPSKAHGELFSLKLAKAQTVNNINRDCFTVIDDQQQFGLDNTDIMTVQINGFRYAGDDELYGMEQFNPALVSQLWNIIHSRYKREISIVAYRPKHKKAFGHLPKFFPTTIQMLKEELKANPDLAWEVLLRRLDIVFEMNSDDEQHEVPDLIKYMKNNRHAPLRTLAGLCDYRNKLWESEEMRDLDEALCLLDINPQSFTRKKVPNIKKMMKQILHKNPILKYVALPYYFRWDRDDHTEERKEFKEIINKIVK